jgi:hypothetical protein
MNSTCADIVRGAVEVYERGIGWTTGAMFKNSRGLAVGIIDLNIGDCCILGAIAISAARVNPNGIDIHDFFEGPDWKAIRTALLVNAGVDAYKGVGFHNDHSIRSKEEAIAFLRLVL